MLYKVIVLALSGSLLSLAFPPYNIWILSFFLLIPLFRSLGGKNTWNFLFGFIFGLSFYLFILCWFIRIEIYTLPKWFLILGWFLASAILAVYIGIFSVSSAYLQKKYTNFLLPLTLGILWAGLEVLRENFPFSGFPWAALGYSQYKNILFIQVAEYVGVYGISAVIVVANYALYRGLIKKEKKYLLSLSLVVVFYLFSVFTINKDYTSKDSCLRIITVQPCVEKEDIFLQLYELLKKRMIEKPKVDLVIFPETTLSRPIKPCIKKKLIDLSKYLSADIIIGLPHMQGNKKCNSAYFVDHKRGEITMHYAKIRLVPFGEYLPGEKIFPVIRRILKDAGNYTPGDKKVIFNTGDFTFGVLICYEGIFTNIGYRSVDFLINITNDSWARSKTSYIQHLYILPFRAIENRKFIVRAAYNGISAIISPNGKLLKTLPISQQDILIATIYKTKYKSFYSQFYNIINLLFVVGSIINLLYALFKKI